MSKAKDYKATYPIEVTYLDGTVETIEMPRINSEAFFDAFSHPKVLEAMKGDSEGTMMILIKTLVNEMAPGLLASVTVQSGIEIFKRVAEVEAETMNLGEAVKTAPPKKGGRSKTKKG